MDRSTTETEVKIRLATADLGRSLLEQHGAQVLEPRLFEDNILFDRPKDRLQDADKLLRLRRFGSRHILTYKGPVAGQFRHKVRREYETALEDGESLELILHELGFAPRYRYQKYRTTFTLEGLHICLDETPIGCFLELEGDPDTIDRVAERLGYAETHYLRESYRELHEAAAARAGTELGDLVFEGGPQTRAD